MFKARIFTKQFTKLTPAVRYNLITSIFDFLQTSLSSLIPVVQSFIAFTKGFVLIGHTKTPMAKPSKVFKDFIRFFAVPINFHIRYSSQTKFPPITGMSNIITRPTHLSRPLKSMNRLTKPRTVALFRDNTHSIWFQKHGPEHLVANGRYCNGLPKRVQLDQFQKQISKCTACLPQYIDVVQAVSQQFLPIAKTLSLTPSYKAENCVGSSPDIKSAP